MLSDIKNSIKILQKASTELIVDLEAIKEQNIIINDKILTRLLDLTDNVQNLAENLWKEYPEISRINSGKLLKAATLPNRKEWTKEKKPDKEEQEWLDIQIEKQERIRRNFDKWNREKESRMIYMQYRYPRIY
tara:strand:- start:911 stop:1309 length:399 start_codon:yes stop_codon:yes gene_type:complete